MGSIQVEPERTAFAAGDTVKATVVVTPDDDLDIRAARAALTCTGRYRYEQEEDAAPMPGDRAGARRTTSRVVEDTVEHVSRALQLMPAQKLIRGNRQEFDVEFDVPREALPSYDGSVVSVSWSIEAKLDVPAGLDQKHAVPLQVTTRAEAPPSSSWPPESGKRGKTSIELGDQWYTPGSAVEVRVAANEDEFDKVEGLHVSLSRIERTTVSGGSTGSYRRKGQKKQEDVLEQEWSVPGPDVRLDPRSCTFALALPAGLAPSFRVPLSNGYAECGYELNVRVARRGWSLANDWRAECPIYVSDLSGVPQPAGKPSDAGAPGA